jgi:hypothetical protein
MLTVTLRCPGNGFVWAATNGQALEEGTPAQPVLLPRGEKPVKIELDPRGSALSLTTYTSMPKANGRMAYGHSGAGILSLRDLETGTVELNIDHRGIRGKGAVVEILSLTGNATVYPPLPLPDFDPVSYMNRLYRNEKGTNSPLADMLRAPWWAAAELSHPLPFAAFLSSASKARYSTEFLQDLLSTAGSRLGYTPKETRRVASAALRAGWNTAEGRKGRELLWTVMSAIPNAHQYETDYMVMRNGHVEICESFDLLLQRMCGDCEDLGITAHKVARAYANDPELGDFHKLVLSYMPVSFLGAVTQPSAGTGVKGGEDPSKYGGHLWFSLVPRDLWEQIEAGKSVSLLEGIVVVEGTGIAYGIPELNARDVARINATKAVVSASLGKLQSFPHEISMQSPYPEHQSVFYRGVFRVQYGYADWTTGASLVDRRLGFRGVTWEEFLTGDFALDVLDADTPDIVEQSYRAIKQLVPEPSPERMGSIPPPVPTDPERSTAIFYVPKGMTPPPFPLLKGSEKPQVVYEELGPAYLTQIRVAYLV